MDTLVEQLRAATAAGRVLAEPHELLVYECDALTHYKARPRAVVFPESTEEVAAVVRLLGRAGVPFAPRGAGTGLSGGALALRGGVVVETARMRKILRLDAANRLAVVQTGVVNAHLTRAAAPLGLHYAPDPSSQATCTVGGNLAENAGGIHCLKYGTTVDHVAAARVVLPDGEVIELGGPASADAPGYDLLGVFVGSEGTFGIATEMSVRLTPLPQAVRTVLADFRDIDDASRAVSAIIAEGLIPAALEMVDGATIRAVEASVFAAGLPLDAEAALLVELDGLEAGLDAETERVEAICRRHGARSCRRARDEGERQKLWAARKGAFGAMGRITPDLMLQDAVVPRSRLPEVLADTYRVGAKYCLRVANVFHAGDGNLHPYICFDARNPDEVARVKEAGREIMETCVRAGGTITGEHGTGLDKSEYLPLVFSPETLRAMLEVRAAFDPSGLCNPGKVIPAPRGCGEARAVASRGAARIREGAGHAGGEASADGGARDAGEAPARASAPADASAGPDTLTAADAAARTNAETQAAAAMRVDANATSTQASAAQLSSTQDASAHAHAAALAHVPAMARAGGARGRFEPAKALDALAGVVGRENVSGRGESVMAAPGTTAEVREVLRLAGSSGWPVAPAGGETWTDAGNALACAGRVFLKTERLTGVVEHEPADLVATARAGTTLAHFNAALADAGQWLPADPPDGGSATLGGVCATGAGGAQSFAYAPPRSHVLGMTVALADASVIHVGGRVVKNVAGYDLCKLFVGSHGTLGLILDATFKLRPRPRREATVVARAPDTPALLEAGHAVIGAGLSPVAAELLSARFGAGAGLETGDGLTRLLLRFAGTEEAVAWQTARAVETIGTRGGLVDVNVMDEDAAVWAGLQSAASSLPAHIVLRARVAPTALGAMLDAVSKEGRADSSQLSWHAGVGDGRLRIFYGGEEERPDAEHAARIENLRADAVRVGGSLVVERAPAGVKSMTDAWGIGDATLALMRRVKSRLDPAGMFSPGRF